MKQPQIISGEIQKDRNDISIHSNALDMDKIKRFYSVDFPSEFAKPDWQGHKEEQQWLKAVNGTFLILIVTPDNWENPSFELKPQEYILNAAKNEILHIPAGHIIGIRALKSDSQLMVFSDLTLEQFEKDNYSFSADRWYYESFM